MFAFSREGANVVDWPVAITYGDIDKLTRNVLDALTDARLYCDDSLVIDVHASKGWATSVETAGVLIHVEKVSHERDDGA
jgi:Holliday junction resolvase RusA-like endonuclease